MLSNTTMMDPNMTAADELSNKVSVSVSTVVGAPARVKPLSPFSLISC